MVTTATLAPYRIVLPASAGRAEWLAARRQGIGSSDIAAIMGVSSYGTAQHVYYDKRGELPLEDDAGEAALWGTLHEETVAREWARRNRGVVRRVGLVARRDQPHMMCTLDRLCRECPDRRTASEVCAVEVKTRNAFVATKWKRQVPDDVLAQVLWQLAVTGFDHVHVACLIGGNDYRQYVVRRKGNEDLITDIITIATRLWDDIRSGRVPVLTGAEPVEAMTDLYEALHPDRDGYIDLDTYPAQALGTLADLADYETERLEAKAHKGLQDAAKVRLLERLEDKEYAYLNNEQAYGWAPSSRATADLARLAEQWPDAYADCVTETPGRRLTLARTYRMKELP